MGILIGALTGGRTSNFIVEPYLAIQRTQTEPRTFKPNGSVINLKQIVLEQNSAGLRSFKPNLIDLQFVMALVLNFLIPI